MTFVNYIKSAVFPKDFPQTKLSEIAFAGRSNAGKSSLINSLVNSKIANVSKTPGKTRLLSFFNYNEEFMLVDMPGYGYAARSDSEVDSWREMVEGYLNHSKNLRAIILVMDIRRDWNSEEEQMKMYTDHLGIPLILALTKADKLSRSQQMQRIEKIKKSAQLKSIFVCSSLKKTGLEDLKEHLIKKVI
ncbi:MAG: ribosome biogenesis GTP-binding protein YihA/YsxC [Bdellovibrionaceae bacterium]|nr:ribosome biogenesis GTP-binding protein YihA/YsxC [Pseudobdellovibrionaceae bacterium]NUM60345.1 ribosome biogenesis GTP-binding protein YsxC [Pseudobdellovibrionaceae bacterium]